MYKKAKAAFHFDPNRSWMIGDRETDLQFGRNAGLKTILLLSGNGRDDFLKSLSSDPLRPDYICENLLTAAGCSRDFVYETQNPVQPNKVSVSKSR
jgi:histidinol phosphatase-like enzyme